MLANWQIILPTVVALILGKSIIAWGALRLFGVGAVCALATGICLGQIGEFSFIMIEIARSTLISHDLFLLLVSSTLITMLLTPYLVAVAPKMSGYLLRTRGKGMAAPGGPERASSQRQVLVVGFGPAGRVVAEQVREGGCPVSVFELNPHEVTNARRLGFTAFLGDGRHEDILLHAGVRNARAVVVTAPAIAIDIVRLLRIIAPDAVIVARSRFNRYCSELGDAGAHVVHDEETHVGIRMSTSVLEMLCTTETWDEENPLEPLASDTE